MEHERSAGRLSAKEFLNRGRRLNELINSKLREAERLRQLAVSISSPPADGERVKGGIPQSKVENSVVKIMALEEEINAEIDRLVEVHREIRVAIERLSSPHERLILRERYINDMAWEDIADNLNYSVRQVTRLHGRALKSFAKANAPELKEF